MVNLSPFKSLRILMIAYLIALFQILPVQVANGLGIIRSEVKIGSMEGLIGSSTTVLDQSYITLI